MHSVLIRPLRVEDAEVSFKWRNDPDIWRYTGSRPDRVITKEIEYEWIKRVINEPDSYRFAITSDGMYIGNIQITNVNERQDGEYHIFIGEKNYWGKGIAKLATLQLLRFAREHLNLRQLYLYVRLENSRAIKVYEQCGFCHAFDENKMICDLTLLRHPLASVFIMTFNHQAYIEVALESILAQKTDFDYEIVIGEDCSTDGTRNIIENIHTRYPGKFRLLLHEKNIGPVANQLAVLNSCSGNYIAICEGDDYWTDPLKLQKQISFLEDHPDYGLVFGDFISVDLNGTITEKSEFYKQMPIKNNINGFCFNEFFSNKFDIRPATAVFRRDLINEELQNWPEYVYDVWLFQRILFKTKIFKFDEVFAAYRNSPSSITKSISFKRYIQFAAFDNIIYFSERIKYGSHQKETSNFLFKKSAGLLFLSDLPFRIKAKLLIITARLYPGFKTLLQIIGQSIRLKRIIKYNFRRSG